MTNLENVPSDCTPRVYVACLASYNAGRLHGAWFDVDDEPDTLTAAIAEVLKSSPVLNAEEYAFHDTEYLPGIGEHASVDDVCTVAWMVEEHGHDAARAMMHAYSNDAECAASGFDVDEDNYHIHPDWYTWDDWAAQYIKDFGLTP